MERARAGDLEGVRAVLARGGGGALGVDSAQGHFPSLLFQCLPASGREHHVAAARVLLAAGADPNLRIRFGWGGKTVLHAACQYNVGLAHALLDHGGDPRLEDDFGKTAFACAVMGGDAGLVRRIVEGSPRGPARRRLLDASVLHGACGEYATRPAEPVLRYLLGARGWGDADLQQALRAAARSGELRAVELLHELAGARLRWDAALLADALHCDVAAEHDAPPRAALVAFLLDRGAPIDPAQSPLGLALRATAALEPGSAQRRLLLHTLFARGARPARDAGPLLADARTEWARGVEARVDAVARALAGALRPPDLRDAVARLALSHLGSKHSRSRCSHAGA